MVVILSFFFNDTATTEIYTDGHTLSLHDALPSCGGSVSSEPQDGDPLGTVRKAHSDPDARRAPSVQGLRDPAVPRRDVPRAQLRQAASRDRGWQSEPGVGSPPRPADLRRRRSLRERRVARSEEHTSELPSLMRT